MFMYSHVSRYPKPIYNVAMTVVMNYLVVSNKDFVSLRIFTLYHLLLARVVLKMFGFNSEIWAVFNPVLIVAALVLLKPIRKKGSLRVYKSDFQKQRSYTFARFEDQRFAWQLMLCVW
jgi:hypothetical protein